MKKFSSFFYLPSICYHCWPWYFSCEKGAEWSDW